MNLTKEQLSKLKAHRYVDDVEGEGCEDGRFFVHIKEGLDFNIDPRAQRTSVTFASYRQATQALKKVISIEYKGITI